MHSGHDEVSKNSITSKLLFGGYSQVFLIISDSVVPLVVPFFRFGRIYGLNNRTKAAVHGLY